MNSAWQLIWQFFAVTAVGAVAGIAIYRRWIREPWDLPLRVGYGVTGAAAGTAAAGVLLVPLSLGSVVGAAIAVATAIVVSVLVQRKYHRGFDPLDLL